MKKNKNIIIIPIILIILLFIFIHTSPIRLAKHYFFWCDHFGVELEKPATVEFSNNEKCDEVRVFLLYKDNSQAGLGAHKTKLGLWFVTPNSVYSY